MFALVWAAPDPAAAAPERRHAPVLVPPIVVAPPTVTLAPQITVPSAPPPTIVVRVPRIETWRTWLPVLVAVLSACITGVSAWLAWRSQVFTFRKDAAAIARDIRAKQANAALLAFENNVARPTGMALDLVERMTMEVGKLRPVPQPRHVAELERYGAGLIAECNHGARLCREADGMLAGLRRLPVFSRAFVAAHLDDLLLAAADEALLPIPASTAAGAYDAALEGVVQLKIELRRLLEAERAVEGQRWVGTVADDPLHDVLRRWLPGSEPRPAWRRRPRATRRA